MKAFLKKRWRDIAILALLVQLVVGTAVPMLAEIAIVQPPPALDDLTDVNAGAPSDDDVLSWDNGASEWVDRAITEGLWEVDGGDTELITADDIDFQEYKAIAMLCDNGATVPASPSDGQWYLHTPTGRNVLMQYEDSGWNPLASFGSMTVFVDAAGGATAGTDSVDYGGSSGNGAFATVGYAVSQIPGTYGGNVLVNINEESYAETVTIQGKNAVGDYTITLQGTLSQQDTGTIDSAVQGVGATQGSVTDTGEFGSYDDMLIYANSEYRVIDSDTANTATIVGCFTGVPSGTWVVYDWGTDINGLVVTGGQKNIIAYDIEMDTVRGLMVRYSGAFTGHRLNINSIFMDNAGVVVLYGSYVYAARNAIDAYYYAYVTLYWTKAYTSTTNDIAVNVAGATGYVTDGSILDANSQTGTKGINCVSNGAGNCYTANNDPQGYVRIRNQAIGVYAFRGGQVQSVSRTQYSGNTVDESSDDGGVAYTFGKIS